MKSLILLLFLLATGPVFAHVGSPDVALEGVAGPYRLLVSVKPPEVIPGTALVTVYLQNGNGVAVSAQPIYFYSGAGVRLRRTGCPPCRGSRDSSGVRCG
ncbi:hypothetical protein ACQ86N_20275 [Puia sp. P3]|uniref:hypothetical protein n=1 Tax=Puia sp. P3 TaxID=3423952 RepID=UPI003D66A50D